MGKQSSEGEGRCPWGTVQNPRSRCGLASKAEWREKRRQLPVLQVVGSGNDFIQPPGGAVGSRLRLYLPAPLG